MAKPNERNFLHIGGMDDFKKKNPEMVKHYEDELEKLLQDLAKAETRGGEIPTDRLGRNAAFKNFTAITRVRAEEESGQGTAKSPYPMTYIYPKYLPSIAPLAAMTPIPIRMLALQKHHDRRYIALRSVWYPKRLLTQEIVALVEDEDGDMIELHLHQQELEDIYPATNILSLGAIIIVKEPFFVVDGQDNYCIRVDHISDIIFPEDDMSCEKALGKWHRPPPKPPQTAQMLMEEGKKFSDLSKPKLIDYRKAISRFSAALRCPSDKPDIELAIRHFRAEAYIQAGHFELAMDDVWYILGHALSGNVIAKGIRASYSLGNYDECSMLLGLADAKFPNDTQIVNGCTKYKKQIEARKKEFEGRYDFNQMYRELDENRDSNMDRVSSFGSVEVRNINGHQHWFTTKAVESGALLIAEKAVIYCYEEAVNDKPGLVRMIMDPKEGAIILGAQGALIQKLIQLVSRKSSKAERWKFYNQMYNTLGVSKVDGKEVIDTFLITKMVMCRALTCPRSSKSTLSKPYLGYSTGYWPIVSSIKHNCLGNTHSSFVGDMLFLQAAKNIPKGTELELSHLDVDHDYAKVQQNLKFRGLSCKCSLCKYQASCPQSERDERTRLMDNLTMEYKDKLLKNVDIDEMEKLLSLIDRTYTEPAKKVPRLGLWDAYLILIQIYDFEKSYSKKATTTLEALESLGFVISGHGLTRKAKTKSKKKANPKPTASDMAGFKIEKMGLVTNTTVKAWVHLYQAYRQFGVEKLASAAQNCAEVVYEIYVGEAETFEGTSDEIHRQISSRVAL